RRGEPPEHDAGTHRRGAEDARAFQTSAGVGVVRLRAPRSLLPLELNRALDPRPYPDGRLAQIEIGRRAQDLAQLVDQLPARETGTEVLLDVGRFPRGQRS